MSNKYKMLAKTFSGLESVLAEELVAIGAENIEQHNQEVSFDGDLKTMYKANYWLRTAINILKPIASFKANSEQELYDGIFAIKWFEYFDLAKTFAVETTLNNSNISHAKYAAYKVKDAIVDQFQYYFNQRPFVGKEDSKIIININIENNECQVSLNSSGFPLYRRGYLKWEQKAPINEVVAAGLIKLSNWDMKSHFIDPMCGSGTLLIEAALMAYNFPPSFLRTEFSFKSWTNYDPAIWREITSETLSQQIDFEHRIIGSDVSEENLQLATEIINKIKFHKDIELHHLNINQIQAPEDDVKGVIIINPPYGDKLTTDQIAPLYEQIGKALNKFEGFSTWVISSDTEALKSINLDVNKSFTVFDNYSECKFNEYKLDKNKIQNTDNEILDFENIEENNLLFDINISHTDVDENNDSKKTNHYLLISDKPIPKTNSLERKNTKRTFERDENRSSERSTEGRSFKKPFNKEGGERKPFRKPFERDEKRSSERSTEGRSFKKPFNKEGGEIKPFRKPFERDEKRSSERSTEGRSFKKPFSKEGGERKLFRKPFERDENRSSERSTEGRSFKKPFNKEGGERKPFRKPFERDEKRSSERSTEGRSFKKPFNKEGGERKPFRKPFERDEKRSSERSTEGRSFKKPFNKEGGERKPFRKPFERDEKRSSERSTEGRSFKKPFSKEGGERKPFKKSSEGSKNDSFKNKFKGKNDRKERSYKSKHKEK